MRLHSLVFAAVFAVAAAASAGGKPAKCAAGQVSVKGNCVAACPIEGVFADATSCECPTGYGKILNGTGGGQCSRMRCPTGAVIDAKRQCDCPPNYEKHPASKGKVRCEARQANAG
jgi:hypothetical protein